MTAKQPQDATTLSENTTGLFSADEIREIIWPSPASRPCIRTFRTLQRARKIPSIRLGGRVYFEPDRVRAALRQMEVSVR